MGPYLPDCSPPALYRRIQFRQRFGMSQRLTPNPRAAPRNPDRIRLDLLKDRPVTRSQPLLSGDYRESVHEFVVILHVLRR